MATEKKQTIYKKVCGHFLLARLNVGGIFARSVVWIYGFSKERGALGLILNRPIGRLLGECAPGFSGTPAGSVPVFEGGPVATNQLCFLVRERAGASGQHAVRVGVREDVVRDVVFSPRFRVYGFTGRAEWEPGQLEKELARGLWLRARMDADAWDRCLGEEFWRHLIAKINRPESDLMLLAPQQLELN